LRVKKTVDRYGQLLSEDYSSGEDSSIKMVVPDSKLRRVKCQRALPLAASFRTAIDVKKQPTSRHGFAN